MLADYLEWFLTEFFCDVKRFMSKEHFFFFSTIGIVASVLRKDERSLEWCIYVERDSEMCSAVLLF